MIRPAMATAATAVALAVVAIAPAAEPAGAERRAEAKAAPCFWVGAFTSKRGPEFNYAFPDEGAIYWTARYTLPPGSELRLRGEYPHARYHSLHSYGAQRPLDSLNDRQTKPDRGSTNPFEPGADRRAKPRTYTVRVSATPPPAGKRPRNVLFAGPAMPHELMYRVYVPDRGRNYRGGVRLPEPELELADGSVVRGPRLCALLGSELNLFENPQVPESFYKLLRDQLFKPPTFPAVNPPRFRAFYSQDYTINCVYLSRCEPNPVRVGGQYSNRDVNYVGTFLNRGFGPVVVLKGKLPRTPRTYDRQRRMGRGDMRYWSLCQNESFATTRGAGCLYDEQVPLGPKRRYTIVTSKVADRPENARRRCGVGFVPWPEHGDGAGHPDDALLFIRNLMPSRKFGHAVQDTRVPGDEREVMGPYLPTATYTTTEEFEARGC